MVFSVLGYLTAFVPLYVEEPSPDLFYPLSLVSIVCHALGCGVGESTVLTYMTNFPIVLLSAYSTGTGIAGVLGNSLILMFKGFKYEEAQCLLPFICLFLSVCSYMWLHHVKRWCKIRQQYNVSDANSLLV